VFANAGLPGAVITVSSTHALVGMADRTAYGIAKAGIVQMTRMLAIEWAPLGIRVNAVAPGRVDTAARAGSFAQPGLSRRHPRAHPDGAVGHGRGGGRRGGLPGAGRRPRTSAGQVLVLDGGVTAQ
jgi:NAD(P)-dependent dehydrogenase (short-subunit alcohol dehydrogenase family)